MCGDVDMFSSSDFGWVGRAGTGGPHRSMRLNNSGCSRCGAWPERSKRTALARARRRRDGRRCPRRRGGSGRRGRSGSDDGCRSSRARTSWRTSEAQSAAMVAGSLRANSKLAQSASARLLRPRAAGRRCPGRRRRRSARNPRGSRRCARAGFGDRPRSHSSSLSTRAVMSITTAPAKRPAAGPVSTCQRMVAPIDQPTPIAPSRSSALGELGDVAGDLLDGRPPPARGSKRRGRAGRS